MCVIRSALDVVHEPLVNRDVERLTVRDVSAYPPQALIASPDQTGEIRFGLSRSGPILTS